MSWGPEFRLLLASAACGATPEGSSRDESLPPAGLDWERLVRMADDHGVLVLLSRHVETACPQSVPPHVRSLLGDYVGASELRRRMLASELARLLELFELRGVRVVPYKGPALAALAYDPPALRQFRDLDLVVREEDVPAAGALLEGQGYHLAMPKLSPRQARMHAWATAQHEFVSAEGLVHVDLHWDLVPRTFPFRLPLDRLWSRLEAISLGGRTFRTFSLDYLIPLLCIHGTKDSWRRLVWVCDVDKLVRSRRTLDWDAVLATAVAWRCERMLLLGLRLAADLLGTPLPAGVSDRARSTPSVDTLARKTLASLPEGGGPALSGALECLGIKRLYFDSCDRLGDGVFYALRTLVMPDTSDWARTPLPDPLFPLYYGLRPLHRVCRCAGVVCRRLLGLARVGGGLDGRPRGAS